LLNETGRRSTASPLCGERTVLRHSLFLVALVCFSNVGLFSESRLSAEDWTEFRGPLGNGHSTTKDLPTQWSKEEHVAWRVDVPGKAWSSPICLQHRLYLTTAVPDTKPENSQSLRVMCLDAQTGSKIWEHEVFHTDGVRSAKIHDKNSHASPTPLTDGKRLFVHFGTHGTACLDLEGKILWKNDEIIYAHSHGSGGSPVLVGNKLIMSCDGNDVQFVIGLDADTGKTAWKTPRSEPDAPRKFAFSTPLVLTKDGKSQVISPGPAAVCSYDSETGEELWKVKYGEGYSVIPKPVFGNGLIYVCSGYNKPVLLAIRPDGKGDVSETHVAWKTDKNVPHSASLLLIEKELYLISDAGIATCLDAETGDQLWTQRVGGNFSSSPVFADGHIFLLNEAGETTVLKPGKAYEEIGRNDLGEKTLASFAIADGAFFIRTEGGLYRVQAN
jgi:outer membrane protein assembly factor BamB